LQRFNINKIMQGKTTPRGGLMFKSDQEWHAGWAEKVKNERKGIME
jgi:hypothetical protein